MTNKDITGGEVEPISRAIVELRVLQREHFADSNAGLAAFIRVEAALHFLNLASKDHLKTTGEDEKGVDVDELKREALAKPTVYKVGSVHEGEIYADRERIVEWLLSKHLASTGRIRGD